MDGSAFKQIECPRDAMQGWNASPNPSEGGALKPYSQKRTFFYEWN